MYRPKPLRIRMKCPKHPQYNPEKAGLRFHANCKACYCIWKVHEEVVRLRGLVSSGEEYCVRPKPDLA
jgi:hypothetical protein